MRCRSSFAAFTPFGSGVSLKRSSEYRVLLCCPVSSSATATAVVRGAAAVGFCCLGSVVQIEPRTSHQWSFAAHGVFITLDVVFISECRCGFWTITSRGCMRRVWDVVWGWVWGMLVENFSGVDCSSFNHGSRILAYSLNTHLAFRVLIYICREPFSCEQGPDSCEVPPQQN